MREHIYVITCGVYYNNIPWVPANKIHRLVLTENRSFANLYYRVILYDCTVVIALRLCYYCYTVQYTFFLSPCFSHDNIIIGRARVCRAQTSRPHALNGYDSGWVCSTRQRKENRKVNKRIYTWKNKKKLWINLLLLI